MCIDAAAGRLEPEGEAEVPKIIMRSKGADWTEMRKSKCTLLNGSAWSTEKKYMRRYEGTFDIFFGIEHRLRKEEMEEQLNKEAKDANSTPHTSHFLTFSHLMTRTRVAQVISLACAHHTP